MKLESYPLRRQIPLIRPPLRPLGQPQLLPLKLPDAIPGPAELAEVGGYLHAEVGVDVEEVAVEGPVQVGPEGEAVSFADLRLGRVSL